MPLLRKFRDLFRRRQWEDEMAEEMRLHQEHRIEQAMARGLDRATATRQTRLEFGSTDAAQEAARDTRAFAWLEQLVQDIGYAWRGLRKSPGYAAIIILTLTIGIGGNTACFSLINTLFIRPLAYPNAERVVMLMESPPGELHYVSFGSSFVRWQENRELFDQLGGYRAHPMTLGTGEDSRALSVAEVTEGLFEVFGMRLTQGRGFLPGEYRPGHGQVVVISHELWQGQFGGRPEVLGETLLLDETAYEIVGILSPWAFPEKETVFIPSDLLANAEKRAPEGDHRMVTFAVLDAGLSPAAAQERLNAIRDTTRATELGERQEWRDVVQSWRDASYGTYKPLFALISLITAATLLIACINIINLVLARNGARAGEIAIRLALGASSGRIVRQLLTETMLLAGAGGVLGCVAGVALYQGFVKWVKMDNLRMVETSMDYRVLLFALAATLSCGLVCGLLPALRSARPAIQHHLKDGGHGATPGKRRRLQSALVIIESTFTTALLIIAGLALHSLLKVSASHPGFTRDGVLYFNISPPANLAPDATAQVNVADEVLRNLRQIPGVEITGLTTAVPMSKTVYRTEAVRRMDADPELSNHQIGVDSASPDYFATLQIPLVHGRALTATDNHTNAPRVAVVNLRLVEQLFEGDATAALGATLLWREQTWEIVGIVGSTARYWMGHTPMPQLYVAQVHLPEPASYVLRAAVDPMSLADEVRAATEAVHPSLSLTNLRRLADRADGSMGLRRIFLANISFFAALALLLAAMGIYGVMSYTATQRVREMGIRIAMGASTRDIMRLILDDSLRLIVWGFAAGCLLALVAARLLQSQLYEVGSFDPLSYLAAICILTVTGVTASLIPAWRAARANPIAVLRAE